MEPYTIVGLGEVLWDLLPSGKQLGGAPTNFAYITRLLGDRAVIASRIGADQLGREAHQTLTSLGVDASFLQRDDCHSTGTVSVEVDSSGQPAFDVTQAVAWDFLEWTPQWRSLAARADAVCFGSLAQRSPASRATILAFLDAMGPHATRIFDVNLRQEFYSADVIASSLQRADVIKLNHQELPRIMQLLNLTFDAGISASRQLLHNFNLELVCVTRGEHGSLLVSRNEVNEHPGFAVKVVDTVGSGDAFTAALVHHYLRRASLADMNVAANRMGAWVASRAGGTPALDLSKIERLG